MRTKRLKSTFLISLAALMGVSCVSSKTVSAADTFDSSYASVCNDTRVKYLPAYGSVKIDNYDVFNAFQYINGNCSTQHYKYYGNTVFYRRDYTGIPVYSTIPTNASFRGSRESWSWGDIKENAEDENGWTKTWATKLNSLSCRGTYDTIKVRGSGCSSDLITPNSYATYSYSNGGISGVGNKVEIRTIGYSMAGYSLDNSYFPMDMTASSKTDNVWSSVGAFLKDPKTDKNVFNTNYKYKQTRTTYDTPGSANYQKKLDAIQKLINMGELTGRPSDWTEYLSLKTDPTKEAAIFVATRYNGKGYISITLPAPEEYRVRNMAITKFEIYDDKQVYGFMTRNPETGAVATEWKKNLMEGETYKLRVTVTSTGGMAPQRNTHYVDYNGKTYTKNEKTPLGGSVTIEGLSYKAPSGKTNDKITVSLGSGYGDDNQHKGDDQGILNVGIDAKPKGDLAVYNSHLIEVATGKSVSYPIQGREYYIKYDVIYKGDTMPDLFNIGLNVSYNTYQTQTNSESLINKEVSQTLWDTTAPKKLTDGTILSFRTNTFVATTSQVTTNFTINAPTGYKYEINTNKNNDSGKNSWTAKFDVAVVPGSVTIQPSDYPGGNQYCKPMVIKYKLSYNVPAGHAYSEAQNVKVAFNVGGKLVETTIQVYANQGVKEYTYTFDNGCVNANGNGNVDVSIKVNPYHTLHESNYGNNQLNKEWKKKTYAKDYCSTKTHEKNEWSQKYYVVTINDNALGPDLDEFVSDRNIDQIRQKETMKITSVQFYSKYMKDKNMGTNGWVEVLGSNGKQNSKIPTIKAGYGFDIKITVEYETDAFSTEQRALDMYMKSNETLYNPHVLTTFDDDFYLALKKSGSSDIVISAKGGANQSGTKVIPSRSATGSEKDKITWTYTFKNVQIGETTPDGTYNLALYTKPITGVISKTEGAANVGVLCDYLNVQFKVNGSVYDDVITGTIQ